jgi:hypothetical protein
VEGAVQVGRTVDEQQRGHGDSAQAFESSNPGPDPCRQDKLPGMIDPGDAAGPAAARESWRMFGIMAEFVEATERLQAIRPAVSIFGSARTPETIPTTADRAHRPPALGRRLLGDFRRRPRHHGGGQQGRLRRQERPASASTSSCRMEQQANPTRTSRRPSALLRAQVHVRQVRRRLRGDARRLRHAGRADGGADPDPDRQEPRIPIILVHRRSGKG